MLEGCLVVHSLVVGRVFGNALNVVWWCLISSLIVCSSVLGCLEGCLVVHPLFGRVFGNALNVVRWCLIASLEGGKRFRI